jgi:hypothetical protein
VRTWRDIRGIGFRTADQIAAKLGIEKTALIRVRAGMSAKPHRRQVVSRNPDLIVPISPPIMQAVSEATGTIPIVGSGAYTNLGLVPSLARPGGNITGVTVTGYGCYVKSAGHRITG